MKTKTTRCGKQYPLGTPAPASAKYALWYYGYVRYFRTRQAAEKAKSKLSRYEFDAASIGGVN